MRFHRSQKIASLISVAAAFSIVGCSQGSSATSTDAPSHSVLEGRTIAPSDQNQVTIDNFNFTPATITVPAGTIVTWINHDDVPHTVTANDGQFASKALDTDDRYSHVFSVPGTYAYFCAVHPHMTGQVIVK